MKLFKTIIATWVVSICVVGAGLSLASDSPGTTLDQVKLFGLYEKFITADITFPATDIKIANFSCRPNDVVLSGGKVEYHPVMGGMGGRLGHRVINLEIFVDGQKVESVKMAADLQLFGNVICAVRTLKRNSIITRQDITLSRREISMLGPGLVIDQETVVGKELKKTIRPGVILYKSFIKSPQIIKRGDLIDIVAERGGVYISVQGQARSAGALGDTIKVKNMMSRREVYGVIRSDKEVTVTF